MTNLTIKRKLEDNEAAIILPNIKRCKLENEQELIRKMRLLPKSWKVTPKDSMIKLVLPKRIIMNKEDIIRESIVPKSQQKTLDTNQMKPTSCMKCGSKFFICSFTLSETKDLHECCLNTVRSYLLQRNLGFFRNTSNIS